MTYTDPELNLIAVCVKAIEQTDDPVTRSRVAAYLDERYNPPHGRDWALAPTATWSWSGVAATQENPTTTTTASATLHAALPADPALLQVPNPKGGE